MPPLSRRDYARRCSRQSRTCGPAGQRSAQDGAGRRDRVRKTFGVASRTRDLPGRNGIDLTYVHADVSGDGGCGAARPKGARMQVERQQTCQHLPAALARNAQDDACIRHLDRAAKAARNVRKLTRQIGSVRVFDLPAIRTEPDADNLAGRRPTSRRSELKAQGVAQPRRQRRRRPRPGSDADSRDGRHPVCRYLSHATVLHPGR